MVTKRRRLDEEDDLSLFLGSPPAPPTETEEIDEHGRISQSANPAILRQERRQARAARRARRTKPTNEDEGFSTDSSLSPSDAADYADAQAALTTRAKQITADVRAPEFRDPRLGLAARFGAWRAREGDEYTGAWGGLGMIAAWEFWARLESIGWDPLTDERTLDAFDWYLTLYEYSRPDGEELGSDGDLVAAMVATAVVPRVCATLEGGALDPYSMKDVRRLVDLAEQIETSVERGHLKFQVCSSKMTCMDSTDQ